MTKDVVEEGVVWKPDDAAAAAPKMAAAVRPVAVGGLARGAGPGGDGGIGAAAFVGRPVRRSAVGRRV